MIDLVYEDIVREMENSKLNELILSGLSHDDITKSIQECFKRFFENDDKLKRYRITSKNSIEHVFPQNDEYKNRLVNESDDRDWLNSQRSIL